MFALRTLIIRVATTEISFIQMMWWFGLGYISFTIFSFIIKPKHFLNSFKKYKGILKSTLGWISLVAILDVTSLSLFILAISLAPVVSLVPAVGSIQVVLVLGLAILISKIKKGVKEELEGSIKIKLIGTTLSMIGLILIKLN